MMAPHRQYTTADFAHIVATDREQMTERVRTDVRNLAIGAGCDIKTAWDKLERLMPDLHDYRPVTDEEKRKWYNM